MAIKAPGALADEHQMESSDERRTESSDGRHLTSLEESGKSLLISYHHHKSSADKSSTATSSSQPNQVELKQQRFSGNVSWYGPELQGKKTASGALFDMNKRTAAHRHLPFGTRVQVEDPKTGSSAVVIVNDRGPYVKTRVMDVSRKAALELGVVLHGVSYMDCLVLED